MNSLNNVCIIDLDEVVCSTNELLLPAFNYAFNKDFTLDDWVNYDICSLYDMTPEQYYHLFDKFNVALSAPPCEGALEAIDILLSNGIQPVYVTARRPVEDGDRTLKWFDRYKLDKTNLHIVGHVDKGQYARNVLGNRKVLGAFDDSNYNAVKFHNAFPSSTIGLVDRPHNRCFNHHLYPSVVRTDSLLHGVNLMLKDMYYA